MSIEPIVLNAAGDILVQYPMVKDESLLFQEAGFIFTKIGEHSARGHNIYLYELANSNVVVCSELSLRIILHKSIDTYGKLRAYCEQKNRESTIMELEEQIERLKNELSAIKTDFKNRPEALKW